MRTAALFAPIGAPRKGSHDDVIRLRLSGRSNSAVSNDTGYTARRVQQIASTFRRSVLPRILQLHSDGFEPGVIASETGLPEDIVALALGRFAEAS